MYIKYNTFLFMQYKMLFSKKKMSILTFIATDLSCAHYTQAHVLARIQRESRKRTYVIIISRRTQLNHIYLSENSLIVFFFYFHFVLWRLTSDGAVYGVFNIYFVVLARGGGDGWRTFTPNARNPPPSVSHRFVSAFDCCPSCNATIYIYIYTLRQRLQTSSDQCAVVVVVVIAAVTVYFHTTAIYIYINKNTRPIARVRAATSVRIRFQPRHSDKTRLAYSVPFSRRV